MITAHNISVEFGLQQLFQEASFTINRKEKIALVGKNGAGKSTLMKLIAGMQLPTSGVISHAKNCVIGYLSQQLPMHTNKTVIEAVKAVFQEEKKLEQEVKILEKQIANSVDYNSMEYLELVNRFTQETERLAELQSFNSDAAVEKILLGLGFRRPDFQRLTSEFSGGWRMRIELAKLLLIRPDLLLLDEPTNHLDIESIYWLEKYLQRSNSAVLLVSHDRTFLNNVTNRTLDISCRKIIDYKVKYDDYIKLFAERREQQLKAYENQQKEIAEINNFIERFRYKATKATQVQSRIKQLEKMELIEVDEVDTRTLHLSFPPCIRSGEYPIIGQNISKSYGDKTVFKNVDLTIKRGEKVAFVGKNGEGKSTMIKCIMHEIPFEGNLQQGHNLSIGYFAQNQAELLDEERTVYDTIDCIARGEARLKIHDLLGAFLFKTGDFEKRVKVLSGGERTRLAMIKLLLEPVNFLILDEPTNHLDLRTKDVLKKAILGFDGTVVIVSHDRDFLDGLTERIYEFCNGGVREFMGNIYDYLNQKEQFLSIDLEKQRGYSNDKNKKSPSPTPSQGKENYEQQKELAKQIKKLQKSVDISEKEVITIEEQLQKIEQELAERSQSTPELLEIYAHLQKQLETAMKHWEIALGHLEVIQKKAL